MSIELLVIGCWVFTILFVILATMALELLLSQFIQKKWRHGIPVLAGVAIAGPAMYLAKAFGITMQGGVPFIWAVFLIALILSFLGTLIGCLISKRLSQ